MSTDMTLQPFGTSSVYTINNVNVETFSSEVVFAEDNMTSIGSRMHVQGTGIMSEEDWTYIQAHLKVASSRLNYGRMQMPSAAPYLFNFTAGNSDIGGPFCKLNGTQIIGTKVVLVRFEIETRERADQCGLPVVAHTWVQKMTMDAAGRPTRSINGALRIPRSATTSGGVASNTSWASTAPIADLFRRAILPDVPGAGWRRESQEFAYDQNSTALLYQVVDKQYAYDLPDGVIVGDMDFSFERRAEDAGIGHCTFTCELEGSLALAGITGTTPNRRLVEAAVQLSKTRINANYNSCLITRMRVHEKGILSGYAIRLEVDADVFPDDGAGALVPLAFMIGQAFTITRTTSRAADAYGAAVPVAGVATQYAMVPHYVSNLLNGMNCQGAESNMPRASLTTITGANSYGSVSVTVTATTQGVSAMNSPFGGDFTSSEQQYPNSEQGSARIVAHNVANTQASYDSGICRLSPMYTDTTDFLFQTRKPCVIVTERTEASRANVAPGKATRPLPTGAYLISDNYQVAFGKYDGQGNRLFTGVYDRTFAMYDNGGSSSHGFYSQTTPGGPSVRAWQAPNNVVLPTIALTGTTASQATTSSVFAAATDANARYPVYGETFVT